MAKKNNNDFLTESPATSEKRSARKIFTDVVGIFIVISLIIGTFLVVRNREKIIASLPISTDEDGKLVIGKKKQTQVVKSNKLEKPDSFSFGTTYENIEMKVESFEAKDDGFEFTISFYRKGLKKPVHIYCEKMTVDGFEITNTFDVTIPVDTTATVDIKIDKQELDVYEITKPNNIIFFLINEQEKEEGRLPTKTKLSTIYYAPMDNSVRGLIQLGSEENVTVSFYKQVSDMENTYLYFDVKSQNGNRTFLKVKKLIINDVIYDTDLEEEVYFSTEKLFYIKIPRKDIPNVRKFTISFYILVGTDVKEQKIYITNDYTHNE